MIAFLYARVSTDRKVSEKKRRQEVGNQLREMRQFADNTGWQIRREYIDRVTASGKRTREQFDEMLEACSRREVKGVLIWALDRFSREGPLRTMLLLDRLNSAGVRVRSLKEPWLDPDSPTYELLLPIFAWIAKQESLRLSQRVKAGMARAKEQGRKFGRPRHGVDALQIAILRERGHSLRSIARQVGISEGSVRRALKSPVRLRKKGGRKLGEFSTGLTGVRLAGNRRAGKGT